MRSGEDKEQETPSRLKIGGMALENGVLFQTESHWAMALRRPDGEIEISSGGKLLPARLRNMKKIPLLRGLAGLAENAKVLPQAIARGGEVTALTRSPQMLAAMLVSVVGTIIVRNPKKDLPPLMEETLVSALALMPALVAVRKTRAIQYHAAEHKSINAYELSGIVDESNIQTAGARHARCGTNIIGPVLVLMTLGNTLAHRFLGRRRQVARLGVSILSISGAVELVQWAARHPQSPWSKILSLPGEELQNLLTTAEPSADQLEVSLAALKELLRLEKALPEQAGVA
ncbi:MAG: DUF1385 domain-containing protein [Thermoleophilia bacterium]|nr:DUF1385 domain-containing protein [Thermoleophilia bacterium]